VKKSNQIITDEAITSVVAAAENFDKALENAEKQLQQTVFPFRKTALQRFPVLFLLAVTFGAVTTEFGLEGLFVKYDVFNDKPWIPLVIGVAVLISTGVAYKRSK
jgi:hypothetical protein